jgi:DNA-binding Lrp family transcriptional regulator
MAKRSRHQVEKDERKVVNLLQTRAKDSIDSLAATCSFSGPKVRRIIKHLEDTQTIWGYHAVTDYEKLGMHEYILLIKKTNKPLDELAQRIISRDIEKKAENLDIFIGSSFYLHGSYDWVMCFVAEDLRTAKKFDGELVKMFKEHIQETSLVENIFPVKRCGIDNPNLKKLMGFL